jgi:hypothetical protein
MFHSVCAFASSHDPPRRNFSCRFPGIRSDLEMFSYAFSWHPWTDSKQLFGTGEGIRKVRVRVFSSFHDSVQRLSASGAYPFSFVLPPLFCWIRVGLFFCNLIKSTFMRSWISTTWRATYVQVSKFTAPTLNPATQDGCFGRLPGKSVLSSCLYAWVIMR